MPVYRVTISKHLIDGPYVGKDWSNVYHLNDPDLATALLHAGGLVTAEKALYPDNVRIFRYSVADPAVPNSGTSTITSESGNRSVGAVATQLPPWNVVLCKFQPAAGRASLKWLRVILDESEVDSGSITTALYDSLNTNYVTPVMSEAGICDESGNAFASASLQLPVYSRQQGWHRQHRAGFHRGWVPD